eukprot:4535487-Alexandrium_andersonii.AAC.1
MPPRQDKANEDAIVEMELKPFSVAWVPPGKIICHHSDDSADASFGIYQLLIMPRSIKMDGAAR